MKMKKLLWLLSTSALLVSCQARTASTEVDTQTIPTSQMARDYLSSNSISSGNGKTRLVADPLAGVFLVNPFNTVINTTIYSKKNTYTYQQVRTMQEEYDDLLAYYSALSDRHYYYNKATTIDGNERLDRINNLRVINESYGSGEWIEIDPFLYNILKKNLEFSILTEGKFNFFVGEFNDIYEAKINTVKKAVSTYTPLNAALSLANNVNFGSDVDASQIKKALAPLPQSKEEMEAMLDFKTEKDKSGKDIYKVKFNKSIRAEGKVSMTLGGSAKGFSIDALAKTFEEKYPNICMLINSGASSLKAIGSKPDGSPWAVSYTNPGANEEKNYTGKLNPSEAYYVIDGDFNLSTSGYYENYFYVFDGASNDYIRRNHIVDASTGYSNAFFDQVSVTLDEAGVADMFTTALMNETSIASAKSAFDKWTSAMDIKNQNLILCYKGQKDDISKLFRYSNKDLSDLSSYQLPKVTLKNGSIYEGDYLSGIMASDIKSSVSKATREYKQVFAYSAGLKDKLYLFEVQNDEYFPHPEVAITVLSEIK